MKNSIILLSICFMFFGCGDTPAGKEDGMNIDAYLIANEYIKLRLKSPSTAEFLSRKESTIERSGQSVYIIHSAVDAKNSFGTPIRSNFMVKILYTGGDPDQGANWKLLDLKMDE